MVVVKAEGHKLEAATLGGQMTMNKTIDIVSRPETGIKVTNKNSPRQSTRTQHPRSKTGCLTCRKRKKKCDEHKPSCHNCFKNNVICQGYEERQSWERRSSKGASRGVPPLPQIIGAVETPLDQHLLSYFIIDLSNTLNVYYEHSNPFTDLVLPLAMQQTGLMHSLLCLASSCLIARQDVPRPDLVLRQSHHFELAVIDLRKHIDDSKYKADAQTDCTILQTILHCLETTATGNSSGDYRFHLTATQRLVTECQPSNPAIQDFAKLFMSYHHLSNLLTSQHPVYGSSNTGDSAAWSTTPGRFFLAIEGLQAPFARSRQLRDEIRAYCSSGHAWCADDRLLNRAFDLDASLRAWVCRHPLDTPQYRASLLYRQCSWIYLYRTVKPSAPSPELAQGVDEGLRYASLLFEDDDSASNWARVTLLPCIFLLGSAAYEQEQRRIIISCFEALRRHCFGTVSKARQVVERIWQLMDQDGREYESWDWEGVMASMDLDLLVV